MPETVMRESAMRQQGFTLLELLVVVAIIGMLAGFVGPRYFAQLGRSEVGVAQAQIDAFGKALDQFRLDVGRYPSSEEGLAALSAVQSSIPHWRGPYLQKAPPLDPWGHPYQYRSPSTAPGKDYDLVSLGKDGAVGGSGDAADLSN